LDPKTGRPVITITPSKPISLQDMTPQGGSDTEPDKTTHTGVVAVPDTFSDAFRHLGADFSNQMLAGSQFTTPVIEAHRKNYIGDVSGEDDSGEPVYKDDKGATRNVDTKSQVMLMDPDDGKMKVYNRTDNTDVDTGVMGRITGLGRWFTQAFATGAPTGVLKAPDLLGAAARQGVELPKAINAPEVAATVSKVPLVGRPIANAASSAIDQIDQAATRATQLPTGQIVGPEQAGETTRAAITDYAAPKTGVLADRVNKAYDDVKAAFTDPDVTHEPANALQFASKLQQKYGKADLGWPKTITDQVLGPITKPGGLDYDSLKLVRTRVGEMIENPTLLPEGVSPNELKGLYGSLSEDLKDLVTKAGGDAALSKFTRANTYNRLVNERRASLQRVLGPESRSDEGLFGTIMRMAGSTNSADAKTLAVARKAVGEEGWRDVASAAVNKLGRRVTDEGNEIFTPANFAKDYGKLSEAGKNSLFGSPGYSDLRKALDDINLISTNVGGRLQGLAHPAGIMHGGFGVVAALEALESARGALHGDPTAALAGVGTLAATAPVAWWLASAANAARAAKWLGLYKRSQLANLNNTVQAAKYDQ
jgi:hypothetical protein